MPPKTQEYSVVDPIQSNLDRDIIVNDKLKTELKHNLIKAIEIVSKKMHLKMDKIWVIGSSLTFQWKPESDIDITIFLEHKSPEELTELNKDVASHFNEKLYFKEHPVNFHFVTGRYFKFKADAIYDLMADKWIKRPEAMTEEELKELISSATSTKEFKDILQEYTELKNILKSYNGSEDELHEILNQSFKVNKLFNDIKDIRRKDFTKGVDKDLPSANYRKSNVVFKLLEQYGLHNLAEEVSHFLQSGLKN